MFVWQLIAAFSLMVALTRGQSTYCGGDRTSGERLQDQINNLITGFNRTNYAAALNAPPLRQLCIPDDAVLNICKEYAKDFPVIQVAHPNTCAAMVTCKREMLNDFFSGTLYRIEAYAIAASEGTFWNDAIKAFDRITVVNSCEADPCKTNKPMTDGLHCYSYMECVQNGDKNTYVKKFCDDNQAFDVATGTCVEDENCKREVPAIYRNLYCNATVPTERIPGLLDGAYYNRTFINEVDGEISTLAQYCTASMVFDTENPEECKCILAEVASCPKTLINLDSEVPTQSWVSAPIQDGKFGVESSNSQYPGWAAFDGSERSYYMAGGLANNELAGDFTLSFRFALRQLPLGGDVALMSNALNAESCPNLSLGCYLNSQNAVVCSAVNYLGDSVTVTSSPVSPTTATNVELRRDLGQLTLVVNGAETKATESLGFERLRATNCGLVIGQSNQRARFIGWMDKVKLESRCKN